MKYIRRGKRYYEVSKLTEKEKKKIGLKVEKQPTKSKKIPKKLKDKE